MKTCTDCKYVQGNECIRYNGPSNAACGLVTGAWYAINDLIAALVCLGGSSNGGGSGDCKECICLMVQGFNNASGLGENAAATLRYRIYADAAHSALVLSKDLQEGTSDTFMVKGALPYDQVHPVISVVMQKDNEDNPYYTNGFSVDMILVAGGIIRYARSLASPSEGEHVFADIPAALPTGVITLYLVANQFDTNDGPGPGVVAVGGDLLLSSVFSTQVSLIGGGDVDRPSLSWPVQDGPSTEFDFTNFDTQVYGSTATGMEITISGTNQESGPIWVQFTASADASLSFTQQVVAGGSYNRTVFLSLAQAENNDFLIRFH